MISTFSCGNRRLVIAMENGVEIRPVTSWLSPRRLSLTVRVFITRRFPASSPCVLHMVFHKAAIKKGNARASARSKEGYRDIVSSHGRKSVKITMNDFLYYNLLFFISEGIQFAIFLRILSFL